MNFKLRIFAIVLTAIVAFSTRAQERVQITSGVIEGTTSSGGIRVFKGIPFAEPPVGDLRWKAPQPVKAWEGVKKTQAFGPSAYQNALAGAMMGVPGPFKEDCLYLNVWTPAKRDDERLPVMVWIHGGAFALGSPSQALYDGTRLARKGVVVISIAYRLGALGFLAHPELSREEGRRSGNYGLLDQVAALEWVRDNVAKFGGDPKCVTIFGESAGGMSVSMLAASPRAKGLFRRAISESGGSFAPAKLANEGGQIVMPLKLAEEQGERFLADLGVKDIAAARKLPASDLLRGNILWWPVFDGEMLPRDPYELYAAGKFNDTPILVGSNSDEGAMFVRPGATVEEFNARIRADFGALSDAILAVYPHSTATEVFKASKGIFRDAIMAWPTWTWAKFQSEKGKEKAYVYYFDQHGPESPDGANHAAELAYVFGNPWQSDRKMRPAEEKLCDWIQGYWVNFARSGNPNGQGLPQWPNFTTANQQVMRLNATPGPGPVPNLKQLEAFDAYFAWRRGDKREALHR